MSRDTYSLKLPHSIKRAAQRLAKEDGVSLNQWIAAAVAEKIGVVETAAEFFKKRAGKATGHLDSGTVSGKYRFGEKRGTIGPALL